jgi:glycine betaine/proline transport system substrate-binding protein
VRTLLNEVSIPLDAIFAQNARMNDGEGDPEDIAAHAAEWIEKNRDKVDGWLDAARNGS